MLIFLILVFLENYDVGFQLGISKELLILGIEVLLERLNVPGRVFKRLVFPFELALHLMNLLSQGLYMLFNGFSPFCIVISIT